MENWIIEDVWFFDASKGIVVGREGVILYTTDGGNSWHTQNSGTKNSLTGICFSDSLHGWIAGWNGTILYTNNGGKTWIKQASNLSANFNEVFCIDSSTAWVLSDIEKSGIIYHTRDGGISWTRQKTGVRTYINDVFFSDPDTGVAVGGWRRYWGVRPYFSGYILRTTNGGATWHLKYHDTTVIGFEGVVFTDALSGIVVGAGGTILRTTDGGASWTRQVSGTTMDLRDACFPDTDTGYVVGGESSIPFQGGTILRTTDGGETWIKQEIPIQNTLTSVFFTDTKTGTAAGYSTILRTFSGGEAVKRKHRRGP